MRRAIALAAKGRPAPDVRLGALGFRQGRVAVRWSRRHADEQLDVPRCEELYLTVEPSPAHAASLAKHRRLVIGALDPRWPQKGIRALRRRGAAVIRGVLADECRGVDREWFFARENQRPYVVLKSAVTLDGRIATAAGESKWITGEAARAVGRRLRDRLDAIVVGRGTVRTDDPLLTARFRGARDPVRIVLASTLQIPRTAKVVQTARQVRTIVATTRAAPASRRKALIAKGVDVWTLRKRRGRVDVRALLERLYQEELLSLLVEGGESVAGSFVDAGLVDEVNLFIAPKLVGGRDAPMAVGGEGIARLADALQFDDVTTVRCDDDVLIVARRG